MTLKSVPIGCALLFCAACSFSSPKEGAAGGIVSPQGSQPVGYNQVQAAVLSRRCLECHNGARAEGGANFEGYDNTVRWLSRIEYRATQDRTMPPAGPLPEGEMQLLRAWVAGGGLPGDGISIGPAQTNPKLRNVPITWGLLRKEVFEKHCFECHAGSVPEKNLDLSDLAQARAKAAEIFERAVVVRDMPLTPLPALNIDERRAIGAWIAEGMPE